MPLIIRRLIRFPSDRILREQIILIRKNDPACLLGMIAASFIIGNVIYFETGSSFVLFWFAFYVVLTVIWSLAQRRFPKVPAKSPIDETKIRIALVIVYSSAWGLMAAIFMPSATPSVQVTITMGTAALVAGSVATQSPCIPLCLGFIGPAFTGMTIGLVSRGEALDYTHAVGWIMYLMAVLLCMINMEKTIRNAIALGFDKEELIDQLHNSLDEIEEVNAAKTRFLASASHDLRQPIQAMSLVTEAMKGSQLNDYQLKLHGHMQAAVESTYNMLDSLLDFSKVDAGAIVPKIETFSIDKLLNHLEAELSPLADRKNLKFRCRSTKAIAESDPRIVEMILRNLITNAIRYTPSGGILLACRKLSNKMVSLEVWDTGIGMSEEDTSQIFKEFHQIQNPKSDGRKGFGLGLAISQGLAKAINAEITVESQLDKGSVFRFRIPSSQSSVIDDLPETVSIQDFKGKSILVIDDNERIRESMKTLLESWGCHCHASDSVQSALQYVTHRQPDIMLVDYRLADERTGSQAINTIRTFFGVDIPAVIITGDSAKNRLNEVKGAVPAFIRKPASASKLRQTINSLL